MICRLAMGFVMGLGSLGLAQGTPPAATGANDAYGAPSISVGPIHVVAGNIAVHRTILFGHEPRPQTLTTLNLNVTADANVAVPYLSDLKIDAIVDPQGHIIAGKLRTFGDTLAFNRGQATLPIEMPDLPAGITRIGKLACTFNAAIAKTEPLEITDLTQDRTIDRQTSGGATVSLSFRKTAEGFAVEMNANLKPDELGAAKRMSRAFANSNIRVLDAEGKIFNSFGGSTTPNEAHVSRTINYRVGAGTQNVSLGAPAKLIWDVPVYLAVTPIHVEFKDLIMP